MAATCRCPISASNFDRIVYFLNRVSFCVDGKLCIARVADAYFRDYAVRSGATFPATSRSSASPVRANYAAAIEKYVRRRRRSPTSAK